ncbi:MAG TPA: hypothetical protein VLM38_22045, partial [Blastocatellia bacterium]|nr:hypothetical protein [Blastocatellia bacterium]
ELCVFARNEGSEGQVSAQRRNVPQRRKEPIRAVLRLLERQSLDSLCSSTAKIIVAKESHQ